MPPPGSPNEPTNHDAPRRPAAPGEAPDTVAGAPAIFPRTIGRYEVRDSLGKGAFGVVYRGYDPDLRREVAIKVPYGDGLMPEFRERFLREARAAATIHHPNVCPVYDVGTDGDLPYLVMLFVRGQSLADILTKRTSLPPRQAARAARKVALGVAAAHDKGITHRDLKPQNILYDEARKEILITDFGMARVGGESQLTREGNVLGTPCYMAPEQARGDLARVGPLSDVYSLGVILYRMLTGETPYRGTFFEVVTQAWEGNPRPPAELRPELDVRLSNLCLKAMARDPDDRYPSARELADALTPFTRDSRADLGEGRRPRRAILIAGVIAAVGPAAAIWYFTRPDPQHPVPNPPSPDPFEQAAERAAAEWVLRSGGGLEVVDRGTGNRSGPKHAVDLPAAFHVSRVTLNKTGAGMPDVITDDAVRANLASLSGPLAIDLGICPRLTDAGFAALGRIRGLWTLIVEAAPRVSDAGAANLARHPTLKVVHLTASSLTASGVAQLATIPNLEEFGFHGHPATDAWLEAAAGAAQLRQLYTGYTQEGGGLTAAGLASLTGMTHLYLLDLDSAKLAPGTVRAFPALPELLELYLRETSVSDDDLTGLACLPRLKTLGLQMTGVTDAGMAHVALLPALESLNLTDAKEVGDEGLRALAAGKTLNAVTVKGTRVTAAGADAFRALRPDVAVTFGDP